MTATDAGPAKRRAGPASFNCGCRPFFLFAAFQAAVIAAIWTPWYLGFVRIPTLFPPDAWYAHEMLFGYLPAVIAGVLLTAVPDRTGQSPVAGRLLAGLVVVWFAGRIAVAASDRLGPGLLAIATLPFLALLVVIVGRQVAAARHPRTLQVLGLVAVLLCAQALFQWEIWRYGRSTFGIDLAVAAAIASIAAVDWRGMPGFAGGLLPRGGDRGSTAPRARLDAAATGLAVVALAAWVASPALAGHAVVVAALLLAAALGQLARIARGPGDHTVAEPVATGFRVAYFFVPVGFLLAGASLLTDVVPASAGVLAWTAGAVVGMTLAIMTRPILEHRGRTFASSPATIAIFAGVVVSAAARVAAALAPDWTMLLVPLSGLTSFAAFTGFIAFAAIDARRQARSDA